MPDVLSASQLADERAQHRAEVAALVKERDEARELLDLFERSWKPQYEARAATAEAQRDAWAARYTDLATAVLEGVYHDYDVKDDSGGSSFLCTCEHDGDGWPHDEGCGKLLLSRLGTDG